MLVQQSPQRPIDPDLLEAVLIDQIGRHATAEVMSALDAAEQARKGRRRTVGVDHPENSEKRCPSCQCSENEFDPDCNCPNHPSCPAACGRP
ncbi:MAG TPA: hypothetical protein VN520_34860 [Streptomyces sp.]|uniref:hypothetical protein n=1 Tax=Streptomyces sp. TaxID=1931 RepID=UPI002BEE01F1|nr:hypothetical protein [Streptomyces sp.]HWU11481.1 hypothetical protein [Streptomyces sp.]